MTKFIEVCRLLPHKTVVELSEFTEDMEEQKHIGSHTVMEIAYQSFWTKFKDYHVLSVNPVNKDKVSIKVVKE
jgi:hypothetical protein